MDEIKKVYWTTGEVAKILRVAPSAIRYWLMEFGFDAEVKKVNLRRFNEKELTKITMIKRLVHDQPQHTIEGAKLILAHGKNWAIGQLERL